MPDAATSTALSRRSLLTGATALPALGQVRRPNIVVCLVDDLRFDEISIAGHPVVRTPNIDRVGREGVYFENAFATTPLCSPSRACFLTGQYARHHGITDNTDRSAQSHRLPTFARALQEAGYATGFFGKWHMGNDDSPRPGFDRWVSFKGQGDYVDPELNEDGSNVKAKGYITTILTERAEDFVRKQNAPFLLYMSHKALHPQLQQKADGSLGAGDASTFVPEEKYRSLYAGRRVPRRKNALTPPQGKPALMRSIPGLPPLSRETGTDDEAVRGRWRTLQSVDDSVGVLLESLERKKILDDTIFVFTSDHGYFYGEHGLSVERRLAYEEAIRIPLLIRYGRQIRPGTRRKQMVLSIDLAPTLIQACGAVDGAGMDGQSLVPLWRGNPSSWRKSFLIEYYSDKVFPRMDRMGYQAVRTDRWKYIRYREWKGMDELYDLRNDPFELQNLAGESKAQAALAAAQKELDSLLNSMKSGR